VIQRSQVHIELHETLSAQVNQAQVNQAQVNQAQVNQIESGASIFVDGGLMTVIETEIA
ncbi:unnamed protein product, partial [Acidithrix sp. C25]